MLVFVVCSRPARVPGDWFMIPASSGHPFEDDVGIAGRRRKGAFRRVAEY